MKDEFKCAVSKSRLEAYIGRREEDTLIELAISDPLSSASVCLRVADARELAATLEDLANRLEKHLAKSKN